VNVKRTAWDVARVLLFIYLFGGIELIRNGGSRVAASGCARASELDCRCCGRKHMRRGGLVRDRAHPHATSGRDRHCSTSHVAR
jgi:hypothetical protein